LKTATFRRTAQPTAQLLVSVRNMAEAIWMTMDDVGKDLDDQEGRLTQLLETLTNEELLQLVAEIEERIDKS
jgi:hypothetical protein